LIELDPPLFAVGGNTCSYHTQKGTLKKIVPATISRWIVATIKLAYQLTGNSQSLLRLSSISAYEVRALGYFLGHI
jgi:hypothetical protein